MSWVDVYNSTYATSTAEVQGDSTGGTFWDWLSNLTLQVTRGEDGTTVHANEGNIDLYWSDQPARIAGVGATNMLFFVLLGAVFIILLMLIVRGK